jgi:hypothetical protein
MSLADIKTSAEDLIDKLKLKLLTLKTKLSLSGAWQIIQESLANVVLLIEQKAGEVLSGPDKKAAAMLIISNVIDVVVVAVDIPFVPELVEKQFDVFIKKFLLAIASGSIDALVSTFHSTNVFPPKEEEGKTNDV